MQQTLEQLLSNTSEMLEHVRSGNLEQLDACSELRVELLERLNLDALNSGQLQLLERFRALNQELMSELSSRQRGIGEELGRLRQSRSASRTYEKVSQG